MYDIANIGPNMLRLREEKDLCGADVARALEVSKVYVGKLERGEKTPSVARLIDIAHVLECTPHELLQ